LSGWVRNRLDGDVEIHIQGNKEQIEAMGDWLQQGPPKAQVIEVNLKPVSLDESLSGFEIRS
jgi:acylphosphatase